MNDSTLQANPYKGPRPFERDDTLYGRDDDIVEVVNLLIADRIVLLYSLSGAGKTSLVNAGVIPAMEKRGFQVLPTIRVHHPAESSDPAVEVNRYVFSALRSLEQGVGAIPSTVLASIGFQAYLTQRSWISDDPRPKLLIFDQFEEILTEDPTDQEQKEEFFRQLGRVLENPQYWALFAMREEYFAALDPFLSWVPTRFSTRYHLEPLDPDNARKAIQGPATERKVEFPDEDAKKLVNALRQIPDLSEKDSSIRLLPFVEPLHLQVVCVRLWEDPDRPTDRMVVPDDVQANVDVALRDYYDQKIVSVVQKFGVGERRIRDWFNDKLIMQDRRASVYKMDPSIAKLGAALLDELMEAYLVRMETRYDLSWYELAHDRLIRPILESNRLWYKKKYPLGLLKRYADDWRQASDSDQPGKLVSGQELAELRKAVVNYQDDVTDRERTFLSACEEKQKRKKWAYTIGGIMASVILFWLIGTAYTAVSLQRSNQINRILALCYQAQLQRYIHNNTGIALSLARQAYNFSKQLGSSPYPQRPFINAAVDSALRSTLNAPLLSWSMLEGGKTVLRDARQLAFDPQGKRLAVLSREGKVDLYPYGPEMKEPIPLATTLSVRAIAFSPTGKQIALMGERAIELWGLEDSSASKRRELSYEEGTLEGPIVFSSSQQLQLLASIDKENHKVLLWDLKENKDGGPWKQLKLEDHAQPITVVAFLQNTKRLAVGSSDGRVRVWSLDGNEEQPRHYDHVFDESEKQNRLISIGFSPDGKWLVTVPSRGAIRFWKLDSPDELCFQVKPTRLEGLLAAAFNTDGSLLVTGSDQGTLSTWQLEKVWEEMEPRKEIESRHDADRILCSEIKAGLKDYNTPLGPLKWVAFVERPATGDSKTYPVAVVDSLGMLRVFDIQGTQTDTKLGDIRAVKFTPDGRKLVAADNTGLEIRDIGDPLRPLPLIKQPGIRAMDINHDGTLLVFGKADKHVMLVNMSSEKKPIAIGEHRDELKAVAFSAADRFVTVSLDGEIKLWKVDKDAAGHPSARVLKFLTLDEPDAKVQSAAIAPNEKWLAVGTSDGSVHLWNLQSYTKELPLRWHQAAVRALKFNPEGTLLATASADSSIALWRVECWTNPLSELLGHTGSVNDIDFTSDGRLVSGDSHGQIRLWDLNTNPDELVGPCKDRPDNTNPDSVVLSPPPPRDAPREVLVVAFHEGKVAWGDTTGVLHIEDNLDISALADKACKKQWQNLSQQQWKDFVGSDVPYEPTCPSVLP